MIKSESKFVSVEAITNFSRKSSTSETALFHHIGQCGPATLSRPVLYPPDTTQQFMIIVWHDRWRPRNVMVESGPTYEAAPRTLSYIALICSTTFDSEKVSST